MLIFSQRTLAELWAKQSVWGEMCRFTPRVRPNSNLQEWAWKRCKYCGHLKTSWNYMVPRLDQFSVAEQCSAGCSHHAFAKASVSFCKEIHQWSKFAGEVFPGHRKEALTALVVFIQPYANILFTCFKKERGWNRCWFLKGWKYQKRVGLAALSWCQKEEVWF